MNNAIVRRTLTVFAVGSTLVYCNDLRPMYDTKKYCVRTGRMERNKVRPPVSHVVVYIPCSKTSNMVYILTQYFQGMETPRRKRVGTRIYVIRIAAAVSREHVLVCITRKVTRPENDMVLVLASKLTWLLCGWSK